MSRVSDCPSALLAMLYCFSFTCLSISTRVSLALLVAWSCKSEALDIIQFVLRRKPLHGRWLLSSSTSEPKVVVGKHRIVLHVTYQGHDSD